jgi:hypothetical protein
MVYQLGEKVVSALDGDQVNSQVTWVGCIIDWNENNSPKRSGDTFCGCVVDSEILLQGFLSNCNFLSCIFISKGPFSFPLNVFGNSLENCWFKQDSQSAAQVKSIGEIVIDLLGATHEPETQVLESLMHGLQGSIFFLRQSYPLGFHPNPRVAIVFWQEFFEAMESIQENDNGIPIDCLLFAVFGLTSQTAKSDALCWLEMLLSINLPLFLKLGEVQAQALLECEGTALSAAATFFSHFAFHEILIQKIDFTKLLYRLLILKTEEVNCIFLMTHRVLSFHFEREEFNIPFIETLEEIIKSALDNSQYILISNALDLALRFNHLATFMIELAHKIRASENLVIRRQANLLLLESLIGKERQTLIASIEFELPWSRYYFANHDPEITISEEDLLKALNGNSKSDLTDALKIAWYVRFPNILKFLLLLTRSEDQEISSCAFFAVAQLCQSGDFDVDFTHTQIRQLLSSSTPVAVVAGLILADRSGISIEEVKELSWIHLESIKDQNITLQSATTFSQYANQSDLPALINLIQDSNATVFRALMMGLSRNAHRDIIGEKLANDLPLPHCMVFKDIYWNSWESEQFLDLVAQLKEIQA